MKRALAILLLSLTLILTLTGPADARTRGRRLRHRNRPTTFSGTVVTFSKHLVVVDVNGSERKTATITDATTFSGGSLAKGADVTVKAKDSKAISVDVHGASTGSLGQ